MLCSMKQDEYLQWRQETFRDSSKKYSGFINGGQKNFAFHFKSCSLFVEKDRNGRTMT